MNSEPSTDSRLRCPTCRAEQVASVECRRCKCDLSLVLAVRDQTQALQRECLQQLGAGDYTAAVRRALHRYELVPDETARRLLSVAYLALGHYSAALHVYNG